METQLKPAEPKVSIIIPTFRRPDVLRQTLTALARLDYSSAPYEIIVVDDGSEDNTSQVVTEMAAGFPQLRYLPQQNRGVAAARNNGARAAHGEILIFLDDDMVVQPDLIHLHVRTLRKHGKCLVNGHWEFHPDLNAQLKESPFGRFRIEVENWVKAGIETEPLDEDSVRPAGLTACNLGVRRDHFWNIGGFDEDFPFAGCEDQEFSIRAREAGFEFVYNSTLLFWHNDHRLTLKQFCERQRRGAVTAALLGLKHGRRWHGFSMVEGNCGVRRGEPLKEALKKLAKQVASAPPLVAGLYAGIEFLERAWPASPLLPRLYRAMCGIYIFRGVREGLARFGGDLTPDVLWQDPVRVTSHSPISSEASSQL